MNLDPRHSWSRFGAAAIDLLLVILNDGAGLSFTLSRATTNISQAARNEPEVMT